MLEDPEFFLNERSDQLIVLDEIHRLINPAEILKIAADHFPKVRIVATGSSTLVARNKFSDTLAGRKKTIWLQPLNLSDLRAFDMLDNLDRRMLYGGMPELALSSRLKDDDYLEWMDAYWAKDLQELYSIGKKASFFRFFELLIRQSGDLFEATAMAAPCEVSRQTIQNYLSILAETLVVHVVRPYFSGRAAEIKRQPKVYAFDTGFVCYARSWETIRADDRGLLIEHLILTELLSFFDRSRIYYWRDKQKREIDFVVKANRGQAPIAIECKAAMTRFNPAAMHAFRKQYPKGENLVVSLDAITQKKQRYGDLIVNHIPFQMLDKILTSAIG